MLLGAGLLFAQPALAADCVTDRVDYDNRGHQIATLSLVESAKTVCGALVVRVRQRMDSGTNVNVFATYAEFENATDPAERRYNRWIGDAVDTMNFRTPVGPPATEPIEDILVAASLYRSSRLISASYQRWLCCGAHGITVTRSINLVDGGTLLAPDSLISLGSVANRCWQQFSEPAGPADGQGRLFREEFPIGRPFADGDFRSAGIATSTNRAGPSAERTVNVFREALKDSSNWTFGDSHATVQFGLLLGYVGAPFVCVLDNATLKQAALPGVAIPP